MSVKAMVRWMGLWAGMAGLAACSDMPPLPEAEGQEPKYALTHIVEAVSPRFNNVYSDADSLVVDYVIPSGTEGSSNLAAISQDIHILLETLGRSIESGGLPESAVVNVLVDAPAREGQSPAWLQGLSMRVAVRSVPAEGQSSDTVWERAQVAVLPVMKPAVQAYCAQGPSRLRATALCRQDQAPQWVFDMM